MTSGVYKRIDGVNNNAKGKHWKMSDESKAKLSRIAKEKGFGNWMKGKKHSKETLQKIQDTRLVGSENTAWKGDSAGYVALHIWVRRWKGKAVCCEVCGLDDPNRKYNWANVDHKYRRVLDDYTSMCIPCHRRYDKKL